MKEEDIAFFISGDDGKLLVDAKRDFEKNVKFFIQINDVAFQKVWFLLSYSPTGAKKFYTLLYIADHVLKNETYNVDDPELLLNAENFANERVAPKITALKKLLKKYEKVITETRTEQVVEERPRKAEKRLPHEYAKSLKAKLLAEYNDDEPMKKYITASISKRGGGRVEHNIQKLLAGFFNKICKIRITYDKQNNQISADLVDKRLNKYSKSIVPLVRLEKGSDDVIKVDDSVVDAEDIKATDNLELGFDIDFINGETNTINLSTFYKYTGYFVVAPFGVAGVAGVAGALPFVGAYFLGQNVYKKVIKPNLKKTLLMNNLVYKPSIKNCMRLLIPFDDIAQYQTINTTESGNNDLKLRFDITPPVSAIKILEKQYRISKIVSIIQNTKEDPFYDIIPSRKNFLTILKPINKTQDEVMLHSEYSIDRRVDELLASKTTAPPDPIASIQASPTPSNAREKVVSADQEPKIATPTPQGVPPGDLEPNTAITTINHNPTPIIIKGGKKYSNIIEIDENISKIPLHRIFYCSDDATKAYVKKLLIKNTLPHFENQPKQVFVKWDIPHDSIVLIVGDIHGDYNALESVLNRWLTKGYLSSIGNVSGNEEPKYILAPKVFVISTGDLIDYGTHSVNVLCAMLRLREDNKDKVMLLCGNHETDQEGMSGKNIYKDDLLNVKTIFTLDKSNVIDEIFSKNISLIGPDMLALHFENEEEGTYFMHGMYPFVQINGMYYDYYDTNTTDTVNRFLETRGGKNASFVSELIQWNDLSGNPASKASERGIDGIVSVGSNDLISVMNKYKIKGFIRGHQDNCGAQYYPYHEDCHNTINIHHETDFFNKRQNKLCRQSSALHDNWCTQKKPIRYNWEILTDANKTNIKNRIITLSMAHEKHTDPRYKTRNSKTPPMGGYIKLTALLNEESKLRV